MVFPGNPRMTTWYKRLPYVKNTFPGISEIPGKQKKRISETDIERAEKVTACNGYNLRTFPFTTKKFKFTHKPYNGKLKKKVMYVR